MIVACTCYSILLQRSQGRSPMESHLPHPDCSFGRISALTSYQLEYHTACFWLLSAPVLDHVHTHGCTSVSAAWLACSCCSMLMKPRSSSPS